MDGMLSLIIKWKRLIWKVYFFMNLIIWYFGKGKVIEIVLRLGVFSGCCVGGMNNLRIEEF